MADILIVDDNSDNLFLLKSLLNSDGYGVIQAKNGAEALEAARRTPPDLVISDIMMPVMDGFEFCRRWKADGGLKNIPFIFYTATYTDPKDMRFGLSLGAASFIFKSGKLEVLEEEVRKLLARDNNGAGGTPAPRVSEVEVQREYNKVIFRKLQQKIAQLEAVSLEVKAKNQELADFFYITSHDLRTPLINIRGFSDNLDRYYSEVSSLVKGQGREEARLDQLLGEKIPEALRFIALSIDSMHSTLTGLLRVSRSGSVEMKPEQLDMEQLVADTVKKMYFLL